MVAPSYKKGESYSHSTIQRLQSFIELLSHLVNTFQGKGQRCAVPPKIYPSHPMISESIGKVPCLEIKITPYKAPEVSPATFISYFKHNRPFQVFFFFHFLLRTLSEYPSTLFAKFKGGTPEERKSIALQSREIVQRFVRKGARTCPHHTNVCNNSRHCEAISTLGTTGIFSRATRSFVGSRPTLLLPKAERGSLFKT